MSKRRQQHFLELYRPVHARFEKFCRARAYAGYPFEDLMNETLLIAFQKIDQVDASSSFLSFLIGISRRILANSRKKLRPVKGVEEWQLENYADPRNQTEQNFEVEFLHKSLSKLPKIQREALILFEITGFSIKEIAAIQESKEAAIKQRLSRGRKALKKIVLETYPNRKGEHYA